MKEKLVCSSCGKELAREKQSFLRSSMFLYIFRKIKIFIYILYT